MGDDISDGGVVRVGTTDLLIGLTYEMQRHGVAELSAHGFGFKEIRKAAQRWLAAEDFEH